MPNYRCECARVFGGDDAQRDRDIHLDTCEFVKIRKERDSLLLQIDLLKNALYAECRGSSCGERCEGGYRRCTGCMERAKAAFGPGWEIFSVSRFGPITCVSCGTIFEKLPNSHDCANKRICEHEWSHIEDYHFFCAKCKATADLCGKCSTEKTATRDGGLVCLKCNPQ